MMKASRFPGRALIFLSLLLRLPWQWLRRKPEAATVQRVLILHQFLLGDALMATSLLAKARQRYPQADIIMACPFGQVSLYGGQPYGVRAFGWHIRNFASVCQLFSMPRFDLVLLMGENRLSYLARAIGARWIVGFANEQPAHKNWLLDEAIPYATEPECWSETASRLVDGDEPAPFDLQSWPVESLNMESGPYVVLHVGASSPTKFWPAANWHDLAERVRGHGWHIVWSCGPGEAKLLDGLPQPAIDDVMDGCLSLPELRQLLAGAQACVSPDTGVAHLAKTAASPLVMLFGPGSVTLFGPGRFFSKSPCIGVGIPVFPCRQQKDVHCRQVAWVLRCSRRFGVSSPECSRALCMEAITVDMVWKALLDVTTNTNIVKD